ncbi:MAG TPA: response regulator transcription factor [Burkholderiales bacterium]|nr:response regulator transcription factor [Burkholderiales bacterium]
MADKKYTKQRVFVADDDVMIRSLLRLLLREDGYNVVGEAAAGDQVVEECKRTRPEVLLLDINMPGADGLQVLEKIRVELPALRVIMISGEPTLDRVTQALEKGAGGFIVKPFNAGKVLGDIETALRKGGRA